MLRHFSRWSTGRDRHVVERWRSWHAALPRRIEYTDANPARTDVSFGMRSLGSIQRGRFRGAEGTVARRCRGERAVESMSSSTHGPSKPATREWRSLLRGPGLLDVRAHPQIGYRARARSIFADGVPSRIEGDLTLRGVDPRRATLRSGALRLHEPEPSDTALLDRRERDVQSFGVRHDALSAVRKRRGDLGDSRRRRPHAVTSIRSMICAAELRGD